MQLIKHQNQTKCRQTRLKSFREINVVILTLSSLLSIFHHAPRENRSRSSSETRALNLLPVLSEPRLAFARRPSISENRCSSSVTTLSVRLLAVWHVPCLQEGKKGSVGPYSWTRVPRTAMGPDRPLSAERGYFSWSNRTPQSKLLLLTSPDTRFSNVVRDFRPAVVVSPLYSPLPAFRLPCTSLLTDWI